MADFFVPQPAPQEVPIQWVTDPAAVPTSVNQLQLQAGMPAGSDGPPDGVYMSWGHASPPAFPIGTKPEDVPGILAGTVILINPVSYMLVSLPRLRQIHEVMGTFLAQIDEGEKARLDRQK